MTIVLADGEGLGGGLDFLELVSDVIGLFSVDHGIEGLGGMMEKERC